MLMFEIPLLFSSLGPVIEMTRLNVLANTASVVKIFFNVPCISWNKFGFYQIIKSFSSFPALVPKSKETYKNYLLIQRLLLSLFSFLL